jgi:hypothetical protein
MNLPGLDKNKAGSRIPPKSVKRFVRKLKISQPDAVWRMECRPGEEMQVDFGFGAPITDGSGKTRRKLDLSHGVNVSAPTGS